jgi:hypothetical protein
MNSKLLKKAKSAEEIIQEIKLDHKVDPFFSPMVQEFRNRCVRTVIGFLKKTIQPMASYSDGTYTCYVLSDWEHSQIWMKAGDPYPVPSGKWMDFPEEHWGISQEDYDALPNEKRAELECKEQVTKWMPSQFEDKKKEFYHPEEHETEFLNPAKKKHPEWFKAKS